MKSLLALAAASAFLLTGCGAGDSESSSAGDDTGVAFGATKEEYQAAFEDVDQINLRMLVETPENSPFSEGRTAWAEAIEDWSGGKIDIEIGYSSSFVPDSADWVPALNDGRLDIGWFTPSNYPELFPKHVALTNATFIDEVGPTTTLTMTAWLNEIAAQEEFRDEAAAHGVHMLTMTPNFGIPGIYCSEEKTSLADFDGATINASGARIQQAEALGANVTTIPLTELYEGFERGVIDCTANPVTSLLATGTSKLAPHLVMDPGAGISVPIGWWAFSQERWESLPVVARQLIIDRLDVLIPTDAIASSAPVAQVFTDAESVGGGQVTLEEDARAALNEANEKLSQELSAAGLDLAAVKAASERWTEIVAGIPALADLPDGFGEFFAAGGFENVDLQDYVDARFEETLLADRPE